MVWRRFDSVDRRYGGHSGGVPPVPIPNTEDKPACVSVSTGVREPLETPIRRPHSYSDFHPTRSTSYMWGFSHFRRSASVPTSARSWSVPLCLNERSDNTEPRQGGRVRPNAAACRAAHRRFKSGPWLTLYSLQFNSVMRAAFDIEESHLSTRSKGVYRSNPEISYSKPISQRYSPIHYRVILDRGRCEEHGLRVNPVPEGEARTETMLVPDGDRPDVDGQSVSVDRRFL